MLSTVQQDFTSQSRSGALSHKRLVLGIVLALTSLAMTGCMGEPNDPEESVNPDEGSLESLNRATFSNCMYQETLLVITSNDARNLLPPEYVPVNGITGDEETAIVFIPYNGCAEKWVFVGITVNPPADAPGESEFNGYLLGTFVEDQTNNVSRVLSGQIESAIISQIISGPESRVEVDGELTMSAAHAVRNDIMSSSPFSIRLFTEHNGARSTLLLKASDLERENSAGTLDADSLFGHELPPSVPIAFVGTIRDVVLERIG